MSKAYLLSAFCVLFLTVNACSNGEIELGKAELDTPGSQQ